MNESHFLDVVSVHVSSRLQTMSTVLRFTPSHSAPKKQNMKISYEFCELNYGNHPAVCPIHIVNWRSYSPGNSIPNYLKIEERYLQDE